MKERNSVYIIAEVINHNGQISRARELFDVTAKAHVIPAVHDDEFTYSQRVRYAINVILHRDNDSIYGYLGEPVINIKNRANVIDF